MGDDMFLTHLLGSREALDMSFNDAFTQVQRGANDIQVVAVDMNLLGVTLLPIFP